MLTNFLNDKAKLSGLHQGKTVSFNDSTFSLPSVVEKSFCHDFKISSQ